MNQSPDFDVCYFLLTHFQGKVRDLFTQQLHFSSHAIHRTRLKVFGHQGVGKTTLIDSLKCGFFRGLLRKSRSNLSLSSHTSPQKKPMQAIKDSLLMEEQVLTRHVSTSSVVDYCNVTKGIQFTYANIPGNDGTISWLSQPCFLWSGHNKFAEHQFPVLKPS